ncbi:S-type anion channel SLAH4-like [Bidens hawaiensis]|uniref:S-type anion channel SLAH4-like n=1 Tax=Bidens hawaiensis TaxID=980011 RepID=UPI0040498C7F
MCKTHTQTTISIPTTTTTTTTTTMHETKPTLQPPSTPPQVHLTITPTTTIHTTQDDHILTTIKSIIIPIIAKLHAGYFHIPLSLCFQTLLWKTLREPPEHAHHYRRMLRILPSHAFILMWCLSLFILVSLSILYILKCALLSNMVKQEYLNNINVNYLFAPWISCLILLQSCPFFAPKTNNNYYYCYFILWCVFTLPIIILNVKIYGEWLTKGKRLLSTVANPASQLSMIGNFVAARVVAEMGWKESAMVMFSIGFVHYVVLFVTLYQRLTGNSCMPVLLRPVMFLFVAAPSMASLAWDSISGTFDCCSRMLFYLSLFLFLSLVSRPNLFKKSMKKYNVVWWAYSYPLTILALTSTEYAQEMKTGFAHLLMIILSGLSVLVSLILMVYTALNTNILMPRDGYNDVDLMFVSLKSNTMNSKTPETLT